MAKITHYTAVVISLCLISVANAWEDMKDQETEEATAGKEMRDDRDIRAERGDPSPDIDIEAMTGSLAPSGTPYDEDKAIERGDSTPSGTGFDEDKDMDKGAPAPGGEPPDEDLEADRGSV